MIEEYFGFSGQPFKLSPDTKFFFSSTSHTKAMAYLHYGLRQAEGFIVITGEIGAGKSMLIGHMLDQINRSTVSAAHIVTSSVEPDELLSQVLSAFQIEASGTGRTAELEAFEDFLYDNVNRGRRVLLVVDEAQNLPIRTIEELRMLTNINHQGTPLFQVFLVGQPEFRETLGRADMEQLRQRVIASYHLQPLGAAETREYIEHRLAVVGRIEKPSFTEEAFAEIYAHTDGVPRRVNALCTRLLLFCALENRDLINSAVVKTVANELADEVFGSTPAKAVAPPTTQSAGDDQRPASPIQPDQQTTDTPRLNGSATLKDVATAIAALTEEKQQAVPVNAASAKPDGVTDQAAEQPVTAAIKPQQSVPVQTVMDQILAMRNDLREAHRGNRDIYRALVSLEDVQSDNVVQIEEHLNRARAIITDLQQKS